MKKKIISNPDQELYAQAIYVSSFHLFNWDTRFDNDHHNVDDDDEVSQTKLSTTTNVKQVEWARKWKVLIKQRRN